MTLPSNDDDDETPISPTELRALRRLAEPEAKAVVETHELWASRYRIVEPLGRGGMGDVFLARDVLLDRLVALKVLRNKLDDDMVDERLLLREARAAARAEHERIARVYDAGTWNDRAFIAMEYVRGETLREWLKEHRPSPEEVLFIVQQLLEGIRALHERGLVHRDLKPENVMVGSDGNLRILDLGIARRVPLGNPEEPAGDSPSMTIGFGVGTPGYMAPEQWQGLVIDARADLFALGVLIYELVVGSAPFRGGNNAVTRDQTLHLELSFDSAEWLTMPKALREATRIALSRDREQRFASVDLMLELLLPLFRPSVPPISSARTPSTRPSDGQAFVIDSAQGSAMGVSIGALPPVKRPLLRSKLFWAVAGVLASSALVAGVLRTRTGMQGAATQSAGMVRLLGGSFSMGSDAEDLALQCPTYPKGCPPEAQNEVPRHRVTVAPFELDVREVTNQEFSKFLNEIGSSLHFVEDADDHYDRFVRFSLRSNDMFLLYDLWPGTAGIRLVDKKTEYPFIARADFDQLPVTHVSWLGARLFCKNAGKRLPSEAEWEFAAAGSQRRPYPWGSAAPDCDRVHIAGNGYLPLLNPMHCEANREFPFKVMSAAQDITPEGVMDLAGNVGEWVDVDASVNWDEQAYMRRLAGESPEVFRGGAYNMSFMARSTSRNFRLAFNVAENIGFRCAKSLPIPR